MSLLLARVARNHRGGAPLLWSDDFAANTLATYTAQAQGTAATWAISAGQLTATDGVQAILTPTGKAFADGYVEADVLSAEDGGLVARAADASNYYLLTFHDGAALSEAGTFSVFKCIAGIFTALRSKSALPGGWVRGTSKTFRLDLSGSTITIVVDGVQAASVVDSSIATAGSFGLRNNKPQSSTGASKFDALRAG